jgi:transposase-like protein
MVKIRRHYSADDKFKVALEAAKPIKTLAELASQTGFHPKQISQWKGHLLNEGASLSRRNGDKPQHKFEQRDSQPCEQIGRLKMELEWLKKVGRYDCGRASPYRAEPSEHQPPSTLPVDQLHRSTYYEPTGKGELNLRLMRQINEQYLHTPFYGWPRMTAHLRRR